MPNKSKSHKKGSPRNMCGGRDNSKRTDSVKDLLARVTPVLAPIAAQRTRQKNWLEWLEKRLEQPLVQRITEVVEREGTLVIFAESAGWSVRVRYAVAELEREIRDAHPSIAAIAVRVMPRTGG
jgi:hypothetical protein